MAKLEKVEQLTASPLDERLENLKKMFPEFFTEGKLDVPKIQELLGESIEDETERYRFTWAGRQDAINMLQTPTRATFLPCPEESVDFDPTGNIFIEGDNLEVLKLLYKPYFGEVKAIYIDPPYNTGGEFVYTDNYRDPLSTYLRKAALDNPQEFASITAGIIKEKLKDQLIDGIKYEKIGECYEMCQFEAEIKSWKNRLIPAARSVYDHVIYDSDVEKNFVQKLETFDFVKLYNSASFSASQVNSPVSE